MALNYPVSRIQYTREVGELLVHTVANILWELGFSPYIKPVNANDCDILVHNNGKLVLAIECLNWRFGDYLDLKRALSIRRNLKQYKCHRLLITSFLDIGDNLKYITQDGSIDVLSIGFQLQPSSFYNYYADHGVAEDMGMKPDQKQSLEIIRDKIMKYLLEKGI